MFSRRRLLTAYRTGRFDTAPAIDHPLARLMRTFGRPPYAIDWAGNDEVVLPFLQTEPWELPTVAIEIDGRSTEAWIDTGGDMLTLPHDWGIEPLANYQATWDGVYGRVDSVRLDTITVRNVPVMTAAFAKPVIGTSFLARFLPTIDYPARRLVLRPPGTAAPDGDGDGVEVPFALAATHVLIVRGSLNRAGLRLLVDSGLCDEHGAAFSAAPKTLDKAGIAQPEMRPETTETGAGAAEDVPIGRFPIARLALGPLERRDLIGMIGVFPAQLAGLRIGGLVSHHFLRHWRWTIDFPRQRMLFVTH